MKIAQVPNTPPQPPPRFLIFGWSGPYEDDERAQEGGILDLQKACADLTEVRQWFEENQCRTENVQVVDIQDIQNPLQLDHRTPQLRIPAERRGIAILQGAIQQTGSLRSLRAVNTPNKIHEPPN